MTAEEADPAGHPGGRGRVAHLGRTIRRRPEVTPVAGALAVWVFFAVIAGDTGFLTGQGTANYLEVAAQLGILTIAVTLLMIAGEFDLSVGSMLGAAGVLMAYPVVELGWPLWAGMALAFAGAAIVGLINGLLVIRT